MFWIIAAVAVVLVAVVWVWAGRRTTIRNVRGQGIDNALRNPEGESTAIRHHIQGGPNTTGLG